MKRSTTKRALWLSVVSMFLCLTMFMGTTFAWFTDEVTSGTNTIVAGNLDVELYHSDAVVEDEVVDSTTKLFNDVELWEPGAMVWEEFTVANKGNLALKYQFTLNAINATIIDGVSFATMLKVAVVEDGFADNFDRASVEALTEWKDLATFALDGELAATNDTETYGIVIWWQPSDNDNHFNMNNGKTDTVSVEVGVSLVATQMTYESDAFDNTYDKDATYPEGKAVVDGNATESTVINSGAASVQIPVGAAGGTYELEVSKPETTTDSNGNTTATMDITLKNNGAAVSNGSTEYTVTVNIGAGLNLTKVVHAGVEIPATDYTYDIVTGDVTFKTTHFSPFSFTYNNGADVATLDELNAALAAGNRVVNLKGDIEASSVIFIANSVMINGNGYKVTSSANRVFRVTTSNVDVILNDVNMVSTYPAAGTYNDARGISIDGSLSGVELTLNDCSVAFTNGNDGVYAVNVSGSGTGHTVTVNGGIYEASNVINAHGAKNVITVKNATLNSIYPNTDALIASNYYGACIWVLENQGTSVYASGNTYIGDNAVAYNLGVGNFLEEGDNVDNAKTLAKEARIGGVVYETLADAVAAANAGETIVLVNDATINNVIKIDKNITIKLSGSDLIAETGSRPFHVYGADLTIDATGSNVELDKYGLVDIKEGDVKITIIGGTFTGELDNGAVIKARKNANAEIYLENLNMTFTDSSAKGSYVYNPENGASAITVIEGGVYNVDCGFTGNVTMKNATVNAKGFIFNGGGSIENCTLTTDGSSKAPFDAAPFCCVAASNDREVTVTNSTLTATNCNAIEIYPTGGIVTVTGSTVNGACYKHPLYDAQDSCSITIDGVEQ